MQTMLFTHTHYLQVTLIQTRCILQPQVHYVTWTFIWTRLLLDFVPTLIHRFVLHVVHSTCHFIADVCKRNLHVIAYSHAAMFFGEWLGTVNWLVVYSLFHTDSLPSEGSTSCGDHTWSRKVYRHSRFEDILRTVWRSDYGWGDSSCLCICVACVSVFGKLNVGW